MAPGDGGEDDDWDVMLRSACDCRIDVYANMLALGGKHGTRRYVSCIFVMFAWMWVVVGCGERGPVMATRVNVPAAQSSGDGLDLTNLGLALTRVMNGELIRPRALVDARPLLDAFLAQAAVVGPKSTPEFFETDDAKLAYVLNCHNAVLLRSLIALSSEATVPERVPIGFEGRFAFQVDGQWRTPADMRLWAKSLAGDDWRVSLALSTVSSTGPVISNRPYLPELLGAQLDKVVRDGLASPRVARVDHGEIKQILFWDGLWSLRERLVTDYESRYQTTDARLLNVLLEWADSGFRRETLNSAVGYDENRMPGDPRIPWDGVILTNAG